MSANLSSLPSTLQSFLGHKDRVSKIAEVSNETGLGDGYWVYLKLGFCWDDQGLHTIHEWKVKDVMKAWQGVMPCKCDECRKYAQS